MQPRLTPSPIQSVSYTERYRAWIRWRGWAGLTSITGQHDPLLPAIQRKLKLPLNDNPVINRECTVHG
jgi:hypothetical protein